ncbi:unnamed protein product, partial [Candidula unifasciata]
MSGQAINAFCTDFFEYDTPMMVHIKNKTVGIINRVFELIILSYIVFYGILYEKGYQEYDEVRSAVATKLKGILYESNSSFGRITWDVADYVVPPLESNAFFVITSVVLTRMQVQKNCSENPNIKAAWCENDQDCQSKIGVITPTGNGPFTGKCVQSATLPTRKVCEIYGWCPVEDDSKKNLFTFNDSEFFTVLIKNNIEFPKFNFRKRNIMDWYATDSEMGKCRWNPNDPLDKYCPIFELGVIARGAGVEYSSLLTKGGIIKIIIDWNCDLDFSEDYCRPEYSFRWLDSGNFTVSVGFNFRYADHFFMRDNNTIRFYRNLYKAIGVHFMVEVRGRAGKFHLVNLLFNVGSGMALMGIASILSDIVVLYFLKARKLYKDRKFQVAEVCPYEVEQL